MGDRDAGVGGGGDAGGDPGHDLELDPGLAQRLALLAAAAEDERVAALEPDDALARAGAPRSAARSISSCGTDGAAGLPCRRRRARRPRGRRRARRAGSGGRRRSRRRAAISSSDARRHQARVAGPGADQVDDSRPRAHRRALDPVEPSVIARASARSRSSRAPAPSRRSASSAPSAAGSLGVALDPVADPLAAVGKADEGRRSRSPSPLDPGVDADGRGAGRVEQRRRRRARRSARAAPRSSLIGRGGRARPPRRRRASAAPASPGPAAGVIASAGSAKAISSSRPSRRRPAAASTIASSSPSASLRRRVSTLPCSSLDLEVGPRGQQLGAAAQARGADPGPLGHLVERRRRRRSRRRPGPRAAGTAAIASPSGSSAGRSLAEWTPRSASPSSSARSTPRTKRALSPRLAVAERDLDQLGPAEHLGDRAAPAPAPGRCRGCRSAAGRSARSGWPAACGAARVTLRTSASSPSRLGLGVEAEQLAQGADVEVGVVARRPSASSAGSARAAAARRSPSPSPRAARGRPR